MSAHAPFSPSASKRWMTCTASFGLSLQVPEPPSSTHADEGTRLHAVAAEALLYKPLPMSDSGYMKRHGALPPPRPETTPEDASTLKPYLDYARKRLKAAHVFRIEERIEHSQLLFGTPDLLLIENDLLEIVDLKTGAGIMVDPEENEQLLTYAYMTLRHRPLPQRVRLTIVQPPDEAKPVKSWDTTRERVMEHGIAVEAAIQTAIEGRGEFRPGSHCRFCKAKPLCPSIRGEVVEALASMPAMLTLPSLAQWLDRAERLEGFIKSVREVAHNVSAEAIQTGQPGIPGWTLKPKRATRSWADEDKVLEIARRRKIKIWQDKLMSPAMAEKAHPNMPEELTRQIVAVSSGSNLVRGEATHKVLAPDASPMAKLVANLDLKKY